MAKYYVRIVRRLNHKGELIDLDTHKLFVPREEEYYRSIYNYTEEQFQEFQQTGTIAGMSNVSTNRLIFDFDVEEDRAEAQKSTKELFNRLVHHGIPQESIQVYFSGNKGFTLEVLIDKQLTAAELKAISTALAGDLKGYDDSIYKYSQPMREPLSKHPVSGLYKIPLMRQELFEQSIEEILEDAKTNNFDLSYFIKNWIEVVCPKSILELKAKAKTEVTAGEAAYDLDTTIDMSKKPNWMPACKYALSLGYGYLEGRRNQVLHILATTYKAQGFFIEQVYYNLKATQKRAVILNGTPELSKDELWQVCESVFKGNYKQHSCINSSVLQETCKEFNLPCSHGKEDKQFMLVDDLLKSYSEFATNIEKHSIKLGIKEIDDKVQLTEGMMVGFLGAPGSGKSSVAMQVLRNLSLANHKSIFFSFDMYKDLVTEKEIRMISGKDSLEIQKIFREDPEQTLKLSEKVVRDFGNIITVAKSGLTTEDIKAYSQEIQKQYDEKIPLIVVDYIELVRGPYTDPNANVALIAQQLKDISIDLGVCLIVLLQPQKTGGDASSPIDSMRQVKGSSMIEQSMRVIFGIYREGYSTNDSDNDIFMTIKTLKNTMGRSFKIDLAWDGVRGMVSSLTEQQKQALNRLREEKEEKEREERQAYYGNKEW